MEAFGYCNGAAASTSSSVISSSPIWLRFPATGVEAMVVGAEARCCSGGSCADVSAGGDGTVVMLLFADAVEISGELQVRAAMDVVLCGAGSRRCRCRRGGWRYCGDGATEVCFSSPVVAGATRCCRGWWWPATRWRDGDVMVAGEMKRCGGDCHGDGRRGEN
ncbi:hypothetical protein DEO72_LG4g697 [Vigna unguiculata]|uniref:Uncharacterized protein n=1 Tax=Vigna unguiculata TaxID=3917 RepID=A0A4D6LMQ0_VIGUN|nr:hypothetical protein DEO72_LG4g697 [Vigna unguiculata]